ncbi:PAAR domain-containing protein [Ectopseudomonas mendocina]|uniref:PAAR domain-containing protein n=1 Tax=Ectopseudomonas mendocina TaxID=300 RepID=A0ABZ2RQV1_ECTME
MSGKPAARQTDPTSCPLPGHGINPIATGSPNVLFDNLPAARETDSSACGSPLVSGLSSTVFINGLRAASVGSSGAHGNTVIMGSGTVIIGDSHTPAPFTAPAPLQFQKTYAQVFNIADSETGAPLTYREFIVVVDGRKISGVTDANGLAHVQAPSADSVISLHVPFKSPLRTLTELSEEVQ